MLMYTSCGWFFDDLSGIETVQILQFAGRAVQLAQELFGDSLESQFTHALGGSEKQRPGRRAMARDIYDRSVRPAKVDWEKLGAHYAVSNLFDDFPERDGDLLLRRRAAKISRFSTPAAPSSAFGRIRAPSQITLESRQA